MDNCFRRCAATKNCHVAACKSWTDIHCPCSHYDRKSDSASAHVHVEFWFWVVAGGFQNLTRGNSENVLKVSTSLISNSDGVTAAIFESSSLISRTPDYNGMIGLIAKFWTFELKRIQNVLQTGEEGDEWRVTVGDREICTYTAIWRWSIG